MGAISSWSGGAGSVLVVSSELSLEPCAIEVAPLLPNDAAVGAVMRATVSTLAQRASPDPPPFARDDGRYSCGRM